MSQDSEKRRESNQAECIACKGALAPGASLCLHCGSFQSGWKNDLRYWATLVGLVAFISTAVAYLFSVGPEIRKTFAWEDRIKVLDVILPGFIVVANTGDGNVFVQKLHWTGNVDDFYSTGTIPINKTISKEPGLETIDLKRSGLEKKEFAGRYLSNKEVPRELRREKWQEARSDNKCWDVKIQLAKSESMLETQAGTGEEFWSIPLKGTLYFYSLHANRTFEAEVPLLGFVVKNLDGEC
jgi:hypothetical protein